MNNTPFMSRPIPRMLTVRAIAQTGLLPENTIRVMLRTGQIKAVYSGSKAYINYDNLCAYLRTLGVNGVVEEDI